MNFFLSPAFCWILGILGGLYIVGNLIQMVEEIRNK